MKVSNLVALNCIVGPYESRNSVDHFMRHIQDMNVCNEIVAIVDSKCNKDIELGIPKGSKVFREQFIDFSIARNQALDHTSSSWILMMDIDERMSLSFKEGMFFMTENKKYWTYGFHRINVYRRDKHWKDLSVKLFLKDKLKWFGAIHEGLEPIRIKKFRLMNIPFYHFERWRNTNPEIEIDRIPLESKILSPTSQLEWKTSKNVSEYIPGRFVE